MNAAEKQPINVYQIENGSYVIRTGDQVTIIRFNK